jgi:hemolysin activation/secretion protein
LLLAGAACAWPALAAAQSANQVLPPTREEVTRPVEQQPIRRGSKLEVEGELARAPCALDGPDFASIHLTLKDVEFAGLKGMSKDELSAAYAQYVGRDVPISVVCEIRDRASAILRDAGYVSAVQVPEQRIADGIIRFNVLMAHLADVRVRGDASGAEGVIAGYLRQLTAEPVFNRYQAERYLLLASDIPGYTVRLTLRPAGTTPGEVIGDVTVQRTPAYADFNVQNMGSKELGRWGGLLRGQVFGLTGLGDRTSLSLFSTSDFKEQQTVQLAHDFRVGSEGLSLGGAFTYAWAHPSIPGNSDVVAHTLLGTIEADYPLVRKETYTVRGSAGMDLVNQDVKLDGAEFTRDRLRVAFLRLGFDSAETQFSREGYSLAEPPWRVSGLFELRQGIHGLGATRDCGPTTSACVIPPSRPEGQSDATVLRMNSFGEFRPMPKFTIAAGIRAQYAWKPLLSFEEFSAGNYTAGRGYDPGALLGDRGFGTQAEIRYGSRIPSSARRPAIEGYAFWDHASVSNKDKLTVIDPSNPDPSNHLDSVGGGARVNFNRFALDASLAVPLTKVGADDKRPDPRFLISLTTRLWPWSYK